MPVAAPRDPGATRDILTDGSAIRHGCPGHGSRTPEFTGFSSEILMADVEHGRGTEALAVRVAPSHCQVFPETWQCKGAGRRALDSGTQHLGTAGSRLGLLRALLGILHRPEERGFQPRRAVAL